jgi:hypothetical protein
MLQFTLGIYIDFALCLLLSYLEFMNFLFLLFKLCHLALTGELLAECVFDVLGVELVQLVFVFHHSE